jgi:hypothetical protein
MESIDKIEKELKGHYWQGDPDKAIALGGGRNAVHQTRKSFWKTAVAFVASCLVVCLVSVSVTRYVTRVSEKGGTGDSDDPIAYTKQLGTHYYPASVGTIRDDATIYADLYYAFNTDKWGCVVVAIHQELVKEMSITSGDGLPLSDATVHLSYFGITTLKISYSCKITTMTGASLLISDQSLDLTPYYQSAMNQ